MMGEAQGYDRTSVREIAEWVGITKAAVYYHFAAREDIVVSLADDLRDGVERILVRAADHPCGRETGREVLRRYGTVPHDTGREMTRFMCENQPAFRRLGAGSALRYQFRRVADAVTGPDRDPLAIFHARQGLLAISWSVGMMGDVELSDEQCRAAAVSLALDIYGRTEGNA